MVRDVYTKSKEIVSLLLFAVCLVAISCKPVKPRYGLEFNSERKKIGLPILAADWEYVKVVGATASCWICPIQEKDIPYHFEKTVAYNSDKLKWEQNVYFGTRKCTTPDGTLIEQLIVTYHFTKNEHGEIGWEYELEDCNTKRYAQVSKATADSVLADWGLKVP